MPKLFKLFLLTLLVISCSKEPEPKPTTPLIVKTSNGDIRFSVEVASTPDELQVGLMNRTTLAFNSGMIFNIYPVRPTAMWMKNTKIPLDMLFVAPDGSIGLIFENTKPMSEELLISRDPVRAVVELNAGQVKRHGIKIGDKVNHALLNNMLDIKTPGAEATAPVEAKAPEQPQPTVEAPVVPQADIPVPEMVVEPTVPSETNAPEVPEIPEIAPKPQLPQPNMPAPAPAQPKLPMPAPTF